MRPPPPAVALAALLTLCAASAPAQQPSTQPPPSAPPTPTPGPPPPPAQPYYPAPYAQPYPYAYPYYPYPYTYPQPYPYPAQLGPARIPFVEGQSPPPGYHLDSEIRKGLVIGGAITLGTTWTMTLLAATVVDSVRNAGKDPGDAQDNAAAPLLIPVIGPFIAISTLDADSAGTSLLIMDGLAQGAGAAMLIAGLTSKRKVWVRDIAGMQLRLAPVAVSTQSVALGLDATF